MRTPAGALAIVGLGCLLAACQPDPPPSPTPSASGAEPVIISRPPLASDPPPVVVSPTPARTSARPSASPSPSRSGFPEGYLSFCNGKPSGEQVLAAVRRSRSDFPATGVTVQKQPVCAGVWQYTILAVAGSEPAQVVTKGDPSSLTVVTVGTDPCTVEVRTLAPAALRQGAGCE